MMTKRNYEVEIGGNDTGLEITFLVAVNDFREEPHTAEERIAGMYQQVFPLCYVNVHEEET